MKNDAIETISKGKYTAGLFQDIDYYADPRIDSDSPTRVYIFKRNGDYSSDKDAEPVWMYHAEKRADQEYEKGNAEPLESFDSSYDYDLTNRLDQWSSDTGGVYLILGSRHNNGWSETDESDRHMIGVMYCEAENIVAEWGTNKQREAASQGIVIAAIERFQRFCVAFLVFLICPLFRMIHPNRLCVLVARIVAMPLENVDASRAV